MQRFVIQEHHARTQHSDFRLERDGVFESWAIPKGIAEAVDIKRLSQTTTGKRSGYLSKFYFSRAFSNICANAVFVGPISALSETPNVRSFPLKASISARCGCFAPKKRSLK